VEFGKVREALKNEFVCGEVELLGGVLEHRKVRYSYGRFGGDRPCWRQVAMTSMVCVGTRMRKVRKVHDGKEREQRREAAE